MSDMLSQFHTHAVCFEDAHHYAPNPHEFKEEGSSYTSGGTLEHFQGPSIPRARFWNDSHGKHGRRPMRPKGSSTVRWSAI